MFTTIEHAAPPPPPDTSGYGAVWRDAALPGVEVQAAVNAGLCCRLIQETYAFCVIPRGCNTAGPLTTSTYRGRTQHYEAGVVSLEEPGEVHANVRVFAPTHFWLLLIVPERFQELAADLDVGAPHFSVGFTTHPEVYDALARFYRAARLQVSTLELQTALAESVRAALAECGERAGTEAPRVLPHAGLRRAVEYLRANVVEPVSLAELARVAGVSPFHFARLFTRECGLPPHAYQTQLRLAEARRQLRAGVPLSEVESGFFDASHLTRHLRRTWCVTPARYLSPQLETLPAWH